MDHALPCTLAASIAPAPTAPKSPPYSGTGIVIAPALALLGDLRSASCGEARRGGKPYLRGSGDGACLGLCWYNGSRREVSAIRRPSVRSLFLMANARFAANGLSGGM